MVKVINAPPDKICPFLDKKCIGKYCVMFDEGQKGGFALQCRINEILGAMNCLYRQLIQIRQILEVKNG